MSYQRVRLHHYQPSWDTSVSKCSHWIKKLKPWKRIFRNYRKFWTCSLSDIILVCRNLLAVWCISDLCNSNYICFDTGFSIETFYVLSWDSEQVKLLKHINTNYLPHAKLTCLYTTENLQSYEDCYSSHQEELKGVRAVLDISRSWQVWGKGHWYFCSEGRPWRNVGEVWTEVCLLLYLLWISTSPSSSGRMTESSPSTTFGPEQWRRPWESSRTPGRTSRWWWRGGRGDWNLPNTSLSTSHSTTITGKDLS